MSQEEEQQKQRFYLNWSLTLKTKSCSCSSCDKSLWTPMPLNSVKSPRVVYVLNFRLLVHPLLIDFGGDFFSCSSCSCSCCARGKRKSTPGWDKTFYFLGADTFSQEFCPKQRELQNSGNFLQEIPNCGMGFLPMTRSFFL